MSMVGWRAATSENSTGSGALKTLLQIIAASNHGVAVEGISADFKGTSNTDSPILIEIQRQTTAGTMSSLTLQKDPDDTDETLQTTAQENATVEPTVGSVIARHYAHPQQGRDVPIPLLKPIKIGGGDRLGIAVNAGTSVNAVVSAHGTE